MAKAVKMKDIAKVMGVSTVTVSKALSDQKGVSEELRVKIKKKADEMGYKSASARYKERSGGAVSYTFGVIVSDRFLAKYESFYWNLYQEVATAAVQKGCFTMLEVLRAEDEDRLVMPRLLGERKTEGLIIIGRLQKPYMDKLMEQVEQPFILLDFVDRNGIYDSVISNSYLGMYRMTNYLFDLGHEKIAFVGNVHYTDSITDRFFGYVKSLSEHGLELRRDWVIEDRRRAGRMWDFHGSCRKICPPPSYATMMLPQQIWSTSWSSAATGCHRMFPWWGMTTTSRRGCAISVLRPMK